MNKPVGLGPAIAILAVAGTLAGCGIVPALSILLVSPRSEQISLDEPARAPRSNRLTAAADNVAATTVPEAPRTGAAAGGNLPEGAAGASGKSATPGPTPSETPAPTPTPATTPSPAPTPVATPTAAPTPTPAPTATPTAAPTPTAPPSPAPTVKPGDVMVPGVQIPQYGDALTDFMEHAKRARVPR